MHALNDKFQTYLINNNFESDIEKTLVLCRGKTQIQCDGLCIILLEKHFRQFCVINKMDLEDGDDMRFLITHIINIKNYIDEIISNL
jgi:hypothetical protein